jgi:RNA polymerase sigma factor (sigma-70 family)
MSQMNTDLDQWMNGAGRYPLLPAGKVLNIAKQIQSLPEDSPKRIKLVNTLVNHNLRLVIRFVRTFMLSSHNSWGGPETCDYLQAGALGLHRAAQLFDPERGYSFSTYANHWIRSMVSRHNMRNMSIVSVSESVSRQIVFWKRNGYMKAKSDSRVMNAQETGAIVRRAQTAYGCLSLDRPLDNGETASQTLLDHLADTTEHHDLMEFGKSLDEAFAEAGISPLGKEILISTTIYDETLGSVASRLGLSRWNARKEKTKALDLAKAHQHLFECGTL